ncbi:hypothetical protein AVEN_16229-1 [Araneus ventricosus]|uniref:Uncharacterized protein n=1 Tax=Araneus ventricosus TaxID=182803 RepID=A0A4Y2SVZ1_ARAVE|nr:hypothetical protein AVEN_16229-1 [Araneus ventricosus]
MSRPTCLNKANEKEVDERLCDIAARPLPEIKECNSHKCPPVRIALGIVGANIAPDGGLTLIKNIRVSYKE